MSHFNYYSTGRRYTKRRPEWERLKKCWRGYKIAKAQGDVEKMKYYAEGIRKAKIKLGLGLEMFPNLDIWEMEEEYDIKQTTNEADIGYESLAQRIWREKMQDPTPALRGWEEKMQKYH
jgi:hypothetical protein